ncbi:cytochrome c-type biogenesis protein CcmH [Bacillus sp. FJAT-27445]|uniref:cytochrome c-type biogenesis protein CcmH n=1 Tax=Bacillus sp. FJAT-27445 TaxID=1679166 RepID=UPI000743DB68|nr:cytochrome c-type biogenesis protein CcmH [Bacillus sp. FJAT-27445]
MSRKAIVLLAIFLAALPGAVWAAYTENSPEFREVTSQLDMDGHSDHELSTCKVRKAYNSEVLEMLNKGQEPKEIIKYYTDELGPAALKVPEKSGSGLIAWIIPIVGVTAGGAIAGMAIKRVTARKNQKDSPKVNKMPLTGGEYASLEEMLDNERKKYF